MPKINQLNVIDVTPEKFLRECSPEELRETELLLQSPHNQIRMYGSYTPDSEIKKVEQVKIERE